MASQLSQPQATTNLLFVSIHLPIWVFHINGIIQRVLFCDWLLSFTIIALRLIHVVAHISTLKKLLNNILVYKYAVFYLRIHQLVDFFFCPLFHYFEWCWFEHLYTSFWVEICLHFSLKYFCFISFLLGIYIRVRFLDHIVKLTFEEVVLVKILISNLSEGKIYTDQIVNGINLQGIIALEGWCSIW